MSRQTSGELLLMPNLKGVLYGLDYDACLRHIRMQRYLDSCSLEGGLGRQAIPRLTFPSSALFISVSDAHQFKFVPSLVDECASQIIRDPRLLEICTRRQRSTLQGSDSSYGPAFCVNLSQELYVHLLRVALVEEADSSIDFLLSRWPYNALVVRNLLASFVLYRYLKPNPIESLNYCHAVIAALSGNSSSQNSFRANLSFPNEPSLYAPLDSINLYANDTLLLERVRHSLRCTTCLVAAFVKGLRSNTSAAPESGSFQRLHSLDISGYPAAEVSVLYLSSHAILASNERRQARLVRSLRRTLLSAAKAGSLSALRLLHSPGLIEHSTALPSNQCAQTPPSAPVDTGTGIGTGFCEPARLLTREQHEIEESEQSSRETEREPEPERAVILTPADMHNASELLQSAKQPNSLLASGQFTVRLDVHIRNQEVFDEFLRALTCDPEEDSAEHASQMVEACTQTLVESAISPSRALEDHETPSIATPGALMPISPKSENGCSIDIDCRATVPARTSISQRAIKVCSDASASESTMATAEAPEAAREASLRFSMSVNRLELENLDEALALRALDAVRRSEQNLAGLGIRSCAIGDRFLYDVLASIERDELSLQATLSADLLASSPTQFPLRNLQALDLSTNWMNLVRDPNVGYMLHRVLAALCHYTGATYCCSLKRLDLSANYLRSFLPVIFGRCICSRPESSADHQPVSAFHLPPFCLPCALHLEHLRLSFCSLSTEDVEYLTGDGAGDMLSRVRQLDLSDNNLSMLPNRTSTALFEGSLTHPSGRLAVLELRNVQLSDSQLAIAVEGMLKRSLAREAALRQLANANSNSTDAAAAGSSSGSGARVEADLVEPSLMFLNLVENVFYSRTLALFLEALALHYPNLSVVRASYPRDLEVHASVDPAADGELADDPVIRALRGKVNFLRNLERVVRQQNRYLSISFV